MAIDTGQVGTVAADPSQWSAASQRSISFHYTTRYVDIPYNCWRCKRATVFTAADQKHTYEVSKAPIDQRRILCNECWHQLQVIEGELAGCRARWLSSKPSSLKDTAFLSRWLELLVSREEHVPYHHDIATRKMLQKLLRDRV
jgi:hypothetical protein